MREVVEAVFRASGVSEFQKAFAQAEEATKKLNNVGKNMRDIGSTMTKRVTLPIMGVATAVAVTGAKFDDQMQTVQAVTRASGKEMENMRELAKDMGKSTRFSASEAAEGMEMLARAGFETDEIMTAIPEVLTLAAAGAVDLGNAADITSNILSGFKLEADETGRVVDILAQASADSNVDVESLGEAMKYVAPIASDLGISIEDTTAAIGFLGDAGIQGGQAGRQLRSGLQSLAAPTDQAANLMNELGIEVFDANGKMKDLPSIIGELETRLDGMGDAQRTAALETLFGKDAMSAWSILVGEGSDELGIFSNELANSKGAAKEMSDTMEDSVAGAFREMKSAIEGLSIEFYEMGDGPLRSLIEWVTKLVNKFTESSDATKQWIIIIAGIAAAIGPVAWAIGLLVDGIGLLIGAFTFLLSPIGLVTAAIALITGAVIYLWKTNEDFRVAVTAIWEDIKEVFLSAWEAIQEVFMSIAGPLMEWFIENQELIKETISTIWEAIKEIFTLTLGAIWEVVSKTFGNMMEFISENQEGIKNIIKIVWESIKLIVETALGLVQGIVETVMGIITGDWDRAWNGIKSIVSTIWESIKTIVSTLVEAVRSVISEKIESARNTVSEKFEAIRSVINEKMEAGKTIVSNAVERIKGFFDIDLAASGKAMINSVWDGVNSAKDRVIGKISGVAGSIRNLWPFSPAKEGPLSDIHKMDFAGPIGDSIDNARKPVFNSMTSLADLANSGFAIEPNELNNLTHSLELDLQASHSLASGTVQHSIQDMQTSKQPVYMNLNIGGRVFKAFVDDITNVQDSSQDLELSYS